MTMLTVFLLFLLGILTLAYFEANLTVWTAALGAGLAVLTLGSGETSLFLKFFWVLWGVLALMNIPMVRQQALIKPLLKLFQHSLPKISDTEREALEAGGIWWDAELFSGRPAWDKLLKLPAASLSTEEQAFMDGPVDKLCQMLNDWQITHELYDLPPEVWKFIKEERFLGMIIPKEYGGLGFSVQAHSAVVGKISTRSCSAAVTVMVPNSLGPAELLLHYGTEEQKQYYLPRLADGREVPCFALTNRYAGSDASSIPDHAEVCYGEYQGQKVLGMRVTWDKRYITLGPVATVLGLAFQLSDPDHILGDKEDIGITLALIPTNHPGVNIGRRHWAAGQAFQNGPNSGERVFIPMSMLIGGQERVGQGWRMLMERLAIGRSISLPALAAAGVKYCARTTGAYARLRKQFRLPIGKFEGVEEALTRIAAQAYAVDAARRITACSLDQGHESSVISALLKYQSTERQRQVLNDALDVHAGRAVCDGPSNYLFTFYQSMPIGITVEGANILTRSMIVFGQGAMRCHPWILKLIEAGQLADANTRLQTFEQNLGGYVGFILRNFSQALFHNLTGGRWIKTPMVNPGIDRLFGYLGRASLSFALLTDVAVLTLGGTLKRREKLSGRFADVLGEMYFMSCVLKRYLDEGQQQEDLPLVEWACQNSLYTIQQRFDGILANLPVRGLGTVLRKVVFPWGRWHYTPRDELGHQVASVLLQPSTARDRLTTGIYVSRDPEDITGRLEYALNIVPQAEAVEKKLAEAVHAGRIAKTASPAEAMKAGVITAAEVELLDKATRAIRKVIDVDDFAPEAMAKAGKTTVTSMEPVPLQKSEKVIRAVS